MTECLDIYIIEYFLSEANAAVDYAQAKDIINCSIGLKQKLFYDNGQS